MSTWSKPVTTGNRGCQGRLQGGNELQAEIQRMSRSELMRDGEVFQAWTQHVPSPCSAEHVAPSWHRGPQSSWSLQSKSTMATRRAGRHLWPTLSAMLRGLHFIERRNRRNTKRKQGERELEGKFPEFKPFEIILAVENPRMGFQSIQWPGAILPSQGWGDSCWQSCTSPASSGPSPSQASGL